ncbi:MAG: hypothetical protein HY335_09405 [Deinococcus sp.]|nr:hypothetical protein [Deinococcus sp.]
MRSIGVLTLLLAGITLIATGCPGGGPTELAVGGSTVLIDIGAVPGVAAFGGPGSPFRGGPPIAITDGATINSTSYRIPLPADDTEEPALATCEGVPFSEPPMPRGGIPAEGCFFFIASFDGPLPRLFDFTRGGPNLTGIGGAPILFVTQTGVIFTGGPMPIADALRALWADRGLLPDEIPITQTGWRVLTPDGDRDISTEVPLVILIIL